jgi:hypothetical protein
MHLRTLFKLKKDESGVKGVILPPAPIFFFKRKKNKILKKKLGDRPNFTPFTPDLPL